MQLHTYCLRYLLFSLSVTFLLLIHDTLPHMFERVRVSENSPVNTVILDLRSAFMRHGEEPLQANSTVFASQQETFWPFVIDNFVIRLARPLDREAICRQQLVSTESEFLPENNNFVSTLAPLTQPTDEYICTTGVCCHLLHVNIIQTPTSLPKAFFVKVEIEDVNDNAPRFPPIHSPYTIVREDVSTTHRIWLPQAFDPDSDQFSVSEYRTENWIRGNRSHFTLGVLHNNHRNIAGENISPFPSSSERSYFRFARPYLVPTGPLDRESCDVYSFTLIAIDGGVQNVIDSNLPNQALTGSVHIIIQLEDVNDNNPLFDSDLYKARLTENTATVNVFGFEVADKDVGENGRVKVNIHDPSGYAQKLFRVGLQPLTQPTVYSSITDRMQSSLRPKYSRFQGVLQLANQLDAERLPSVLHFKLVASDSGQQVLTSTTDVQIHIINVNDNAPSIAFFSRGKRLSDGRVSLPEVETPPGALVVLVHVTDGDSALTQLQCQLTQEADSFTLEEASGSPFQPIHRESSIYEHVAESHGIVPGYRQFALRTRTVLDREAKGFYIIIVECTDSEGSSALSKNASLHVTVTDVNDNSPIFDKPEYIASVPENSAAAELRFLNPVRVNDEDVGLNAQINFALSPLNHNPNVSMGSESRLNDSFYFRVESRSGRIWTTVALDCETTNEYNLLLIASDSGLPQPKSGSAKIRVIVEDLNDNVPEFTSSHYVYEVTENAPGGTVIGQVETSDRDVSEVNQRSRYTLLGRVEDLHLISIDRRTGVLQTRRPIDRESISSISLTVVAENEVPVVGRLSGATMLGSRDQIHRSESNHTLLATATMVVNILNVNDNRPEFVLIEPHKSHVVFVWEQLGSTSEVAGYSGANSAHEAIYSQQTDQPEETAGKSIVSKPKHVDPICERLPYKVIDRDLEPDSYTDCCYVELLNDYDGLFSLMPQTGNIICVMRRPPAPKTYKLTLLAKDGLSNDSLSAQMQFTVVIRSDPGLRALERSASRSHFIRPSSALDADTARGSKQHQGRLNADGAVISNAYDPKVPQFGPPESVRLQSSSSTSGQNNDTPNVHHSALIVVISVVGGILCILLLIAVVFTRRLVLDPNTAQFVEEEPIGPDEGRTELKGTGSIHSAASGSQCVQLYPYTTVATPYVTAHSNRISDEAVYHPPYGVGGSVYGLVQKTFSEEGGSTPVTINHNTMNYWQSARRKIPTFVQLSPSKPSDKSTNDISMLSMHVDDSAYKSKCDERARCHVVSSRKCKMNPVCLEWSPSHRGNNELDYMCLMAPECPIFKGNPADKILTTPVNSTSNVYQSVGFRVVRDSSVQRKCATVGSGLEPPAMNRSFEFLQQQTNSSTSPDQSCKRRTKAAAETVRYTNHAKKIHRANSERCNYAQTSFV